MRNTKRRTWHWKVEPGMEDAFHDLQAWLLSSQRDAEIETANKPAGNSSIQSRCRRPLRSPCCVWAT